MGEDNSRFWLPFQLLLIDEVKIGSHHLKAPPLCGRRLACLSLRAPSRRLLCVWEPQLALCLGTTGGQEVWLVGGVVAVQRKAVEGCVSSRQNTKLWLDSAPQRGRCHRTEDGLLRRLIQSLLTVSSPRPPFTLE